MDQFQAALSAITKKIQDASVFKEEISRILSEILIVPIQEDAIKVKNNSIFVQVSPTVKTALTLKKKAILKRLEHYKVYIIG